MTSDPTGADAIKVVEHVVELEAEVEKLNNTGERVCDKLNVAEAEIRRLEAEAIQHCATIEALTINAECLYAEGMEAVAKMVVNTMPFPGKQELIDAIRAAAKDNANA